LRTRLERLPGVDEVTPFGEALHVTGTDREALMAAIAPWRADPRWRWQEGETSLEDLFIHLMNRKRQRGPVDAR
jgi:ABC-2 type transport system ATP-binding protein